MLPASVMPCATIFLCVVWIMTSFLLFVTPGVVLRYVSLLSSYFLCFKCSTFGVSRRREANTGERGHKGSDKFRAALDSLHVTAVPKTLPCRSKERDTLLRFLRSNVKSGEYIHIKGDGRNRIGGRDG